jgi:hypothetical protein
MDKQFEEVVLIRTNGANKIHRYPIGEGTIIPLVGDKILFGDYGNFVVVYRTLNYRQKIIYAYIE